MARRAATLLFAASVLVVAAVAAGSVQDILRAAPRAAVLNLQPLANGLAAVLNATARSAVRKTKEQTLAEVVEENDWKNDLVLGVLPTHFRARIPRAVQVGG